MSFLPPFLFVFDSTDLLFLFRYQAHLGQIPTRLLPLIEGYPFRSNEQHPSSTPLLGPLPSTTRPRSVLHVKIRASTFPKTSRKPDPVFLAEQAFRATLSRGAKDSQEASRWESIRGRVQISNEDEEDGRLNLGEVFDSETIRTISVSLLSLLRSLRQEEEGKQDLTIPSFSRLLPRSSRKCTHHVLRRPPLLLPPSRCTDPSSPTRPAISSPRCDPSAVAHRTLGNGR